MDNSDLNTPGLCPPAAPAWFRLPSAGLRPRLSAGQELLSGCAERVLRSWLPAPALTRICTLRPRAAGGFRERVPSLRLGGARRSLGGSVAMSGRAAHALQRSTEAACVRGDSRSEQSLGGLDLWLWTTWTSGSSSLSCSTLTAQATLTGRFCDWLVT